MVEIKFCGLTRATDAAAAEMLGAAYVGAIFAGGPRNLSPGQARDVLAGRAAPARAGEGRPPSAAPRRVGVFGPDFRSRLAEVLAAVRLDVVQLHGDPSAVDVSDAKALFRGTVWAALRITGTDVPAHAGSLFGAADAVLLDPRVPGYLGGTGTPLPWSRVAPAIAGVREGRRMVLAGGLTPENVREAIEALRPDVVDVSSGVESAPGIKDHQQMSAFAEAVRMAG